MWNTRTKKLQKIAEGIGWGFHPNLSFPVDFRRKLHRNSRLFSREFFYLQSVKNALVGKIAGVEAYLFDCPKMMIDKQFAINNGYSTYVFQGNIASRGARRMLTQSATVLLLKTKKDLPRFFIGERTWADRLCDPIFMTDAFSILGDDRQALQLLMQPDAQKHYRNIGDLSIEGNGDFALFYYLTGSRLKQGYLNANKDCVFDLIAEAEFLIETLDLGKSWEEKLIFDQTK